MTRDGKNQCCVVSGESGSGKTEASNLLVQHFMRLGRAETKKLEEKILQVYKLYLLLEDTIIPMLTVLATYTNLINLSLHIHITYFPKHCKDPMGPQSAMPSYCPLFHAKVIQCAATVVMVLKRHEARVLGPGAHVGRDCSQCK